MSSEYLKWKYRDVKPNEPPPPLTGWPKVKNWFHYNWVWLAATAVILSIVVIMLWQILGVGQAKPDYTLAYVGSSELPEETKNAIISALQTLGEDVNGDGEIYILFTNYVTVDTAIAEDGAQYNAAVNVRLMADLSSGDSVFFLTDDPQSLQTKYRILADPDGTPPAEDDSSWEGKAFALSELPALNLGDVTGLYIGRRYFYDDGRQKNKEADDALWTAVLEGAAPASPAPTA